MIRNTKQTIMHTTSIVLEPSEEKAKLIGQTAMARPVNKTANSMLRIKSIVGAGILLKNAAIFPKNPRFAGFSSFLAMEGLLSTLYSRCG